MSREKKLSLTQRRILNGNLPVYTFSPLTTHQLLKWIWQTRSLENPTNKLLWGSISDFKKRLMDRGWPHNFERKIAIRSNTHRGKAALLTQNNKEEKQILPFVTQYRPLVSIIKEALLKKCNHIQNQPLNPRTYTQNHSPTMVQEEGVDGTPPQSFWYVAVFQNDFAFTGKPLIFLTRWGIFY